MRDSRRAKRHQVRFARMQAGCDAINEERARLEQERQDRIAADQEARDAKRAAQRERSGKLRGKALRDVKGWDGEYR